MSFWLDFCSHWNQQTILILIGMLGILLYILKKYFQGGVCRIQKDLSDKIAIVTGSNTGIGYETALALAKMNATLILACRDEQRATDALQKIQTQTKNQKVSFIRLDLSNLSSVESFVTEFKKKFNQLDILINNAGMVSNQYSLTKDGVETTFASNHLGHFHLTNLLIEFLKKGHESRIINVSALAHQFPGPIDWKSNYPFNESSYNFIQNYAHSKLANIYHAIWLQQQFDRANIKIKAVSLHPGVVRTEFDRFLNEYNIIIRFVLSILKPVQLIIFQSSYQGAQTSIYCAVQDFDQLLGGEYYSDCRTRARKAFAKDEIQASKLIEISDKLILTARKKAH